jgi:chorismate-pyruvate lyase
MIGFPVVRRSGSMTLSIPMRDSNIRVGNDEILVTAMFTP